MNQNIVRSTIDPIAYSEDVSIVNFTAIYKAINSIGDLVFLCFLIINDELNEAIFILSTAISVGTLIRVIAAINYTEKTEHKIKLTLSNVFLGSSFGISKQNSIKRTSLQFFPVSIQLQDQLNLHQIADRFQIYLSLYASFITVFTNNARNEDFFQFFAVKLCISFGAVAIDIITQQKYTNTTLLVLPVFICYSILPLLHNYSSMLNDQNENDDLTLAFSTIRFMFLSTMCSIRLSRRDRVTFFTRRPSWQTFSGSTLMLAIVFLNLWDGLTLFIELENSRNFSFKIELLGNFIFGLFCLVLGYYVWHSRIFKESWISLKLENVPEAIVSYNINTSEEQLREASL